jgi:hypothetical protein
MTVCAEGYCGGLGPAEPGSRAELLRSVDGGVTWETAAGYDEAWVGVVGALPGAVLLAHSGVPEGAALQGTTNYFVHPSGEQVPYPAGYGEGEVAPFTWRDEIFWQHWDSSRILDREGREAFDLLALWGDAEPGSRLRVIGPLGSASLLLSAKPGEAGYLRFTDESVWPLLSVPEQAGGFLFVSRINDVVGFGNLFLSVDELRTALAPASSAYDVEDSFDNRWQHSLPAMFDFTTGTVHPLELYGPLIGNNYQSRNSVLHAIEGSFLRVDTGNSDCLNVREEPSLDAPVVACHVNGVLLADLGESAESEGDSWQKVATPMGEQAWASAQFLQR